MPRKRRPNLNIARKTKRPRLNEAEHLQKEQKRLANLRSNEAFRAAERQRQGTRRTRERDEALSYIASLRSNQDHTNVLTNPPLDTSEWGRTVQAYETEIRKGPTEVCLSCGGLWFQRSVSSVDKSKLIMKGISQTVIDKVFYIPHDGDSTGTLCSTCRKDVWAGKVPKLCLANGLDFPQIPACLQGLTCLEERLISPRIPFMQIRSLGSERQCSLKGSVVNVPVSVETSVSVLPRSFDETFTIQIKLKRKLAFDHHYQCETVRPACIYDAAQYLITQPLYRQENISLSVDWLDNRPAVQDFVIDESDLVPDIQETRPQDRDMADDVSDDEFGEPPINPGEEETMVDSVLNLELAPGEGQRPLPFFLDRHAEELSFPTIHCGQPRLLTEHLTYNQIIKSEARRYDRRGARVDKLFFQSKCQDIKKFSNAVSICLRKKKGSRVTANQALNNDFVSGLVQHDDGFRILSTLRSSPAYWEKEKRKLMAMIRQFGIPTIFYTLSAAETRWAELLVILFKVVDGRDVSEEEALNADFMEKARLIRKDPITCARYFDHRVRCLKKTWKSESGPFAGHTIVDHYARVEFQHRGSPHVHAVLWLKDAPKFDANAPGSAAECEEFIDTLISCDSQCDGLEELIPLQTHHHTRTCKIFVNGGRRCRFGLPLPPMAATKILTPFADQEVSDIEKASLKKQFHAITELLMAMVKDNTGETHEAFLQRAQLTEAEYIRILRSNLVQPKVYLKRAPKDVMVNAFNAKILSLHRANMDIQFILDPYSCCAYIINYINKSSKGISRLLNAVVEESRRGNETIKKRLQRVANAFINGNEISAQEAAYNVMGMAVSQTSRAEVYINTAPAGERVGMLKSAAQLQSLDPESTEIFCAGLISHYAKRPDEIEDTCLAHVAGRYEFRSRARVVPLDNEEQNDDLHDISDEELAETVQPVDAAQPCNLGLLKLREGAGYLKRRKQSKIIRYRRYNLQSEPLEYFRENLMLFLPWRCEETELTDIDFEQKYNANKDVIVANRILYNHFEIDDILDNALIQAQDDGERDEIPHTQQAEIDTEFRAFALETPDCDIMVEAGLDAPSDVVQSFIVPSLVSDDEFNELTRSLNAKQRAYIMHVVSLMKTSSTPFYHYVSGGAGVGKSRLIKTLHQTLLRYYNSQAGTDPFQIKVLLCAPTGKAAYNIGGSTLHSAFRLPVSQAGDRMTGLDSGTLNTYTAKLSELKVTVIDEISMCGTRMFHHVQARKQQIFHNDHLFGGIPIIALGDFRQLPPVLDAWVFSPNTSHPCSELIGSYLWEQFEYFELTEIMRQRDDVPFADALNHLATGTMTADDFALINSRNFTHRGHLVPQDAIRLFRTNVEVESYNNTRLDQVNTETAQADSFDKVIGEGNEQAKAYMFNQIPNYKLTETLGLPMKLQLKVTIRYMLTMNINTPDGLVNGALGILMRIDYSKNAAGVRIPARLWIDFNDPGVGRESRRRFAHVIAQHGIDPSWTPIERTSRIIKRRQSSNLQVQRTQFPLTAAEGLTVHKSQGSTYQQVVVHTSTRMPRSSLYVACSRATSAGGLYIVGPFKPPKPPTANDLPNNEIKRLRANPLIPKFDELLVTDCTHFTALFHNVQSLNKHFADIVCDPIFLAVDLLLFAETWTLPRDSYDFPGYEPIGRIDCSGSRTGFGVYCCVKSSKQHLVSNVQLIHSRSGQGHIEIVRFDFQSVTFCVVYNSPQAYASMTVAELSKALGRHQTDLIVVADMNVNLMTTKNSPPERILAGLGLASMLPANVVTTDGNTQIDWCFSNRSVRVRPYESLFSYHKPLHMTWNVDRSRDTPIHRQPSQAIAGSHQLQAAYHEQHESPMDISVESSLTESDQVCVISDDPPTPMDVDDVADPSVVRIVNGSFPQGSNDPRLAHPGMQCTAIAACSIAQAFNLCPSRWLRSTVDNIVVDGDKLYALSKHNLPIGEQYLTVRELCDVFVVNHLKTWISMNGFAVDGLICPNQCSQNNAANMLPDLFTGVTQFLDQVASGILTAASISVALGKTNDGRFWLFDSHSRNNKGLKTPDGMSCLAVTSDLKMLCEMFKSNVLTGHEINPLQYTLEYVEVIEQF